MSSSPPSRHDDAAPFARFGSGGKPLLLCLSHLRWDFVWQRPQQLLSRCARERRVFYVEEPVYGAAQAQLETAEPQEGVTVVVPHLPAAANEDELGSLVERFVRERVAADYVLWLYTPMAVPLTRGLDPRVIVYDCMDELSEFV